MSTSVGGADGAKGPSRVSPTRDKDDATAQKTDEQTSASSQIATLEAELADIEAGRHPKLLEKFLSLEADKLAAQRRAKLRRELTITNAAQMYEYELSASVQECNDAKVTFRLQLEDAVRNQISELQEAKGGRKSRRAGPVSSGMAAGGPPAKKFREVEGVPIGDLEPLTAEQGGADIEELRKLVERAVKPLPRAATHVVSTSVGVSVTVDGTTFAIGDAVQVTTSTQQVLFGHLTGVDELSACATLEGGKTCIVPLTALRTGQCSMVRDTLVIKPLF